MMCCETTQNVNKTEKNKANSIRKNIFINLKGVREYVKKSRGKRTLY